MKNEQTIETLRKQVKQSITDYLQETGKYGHYADNTAGYLYSFLNHWRYEDQLEYYMIAASSTLAALACTNASTILRDHMGNHDYEELCGMLDRLIVFCKWMRESPTSMARLDLAMWDIDGETDKWGAERLVDEKRKYDLLLSRFKEDQSAENNLD